MFNEWCRPSDFRVGDCREEDAEAEPHAAEGRIRSEDGGSGSGDYPGPAVR